MPHKLTTNKKKKSQTDYSKTNRMITKQLNRPKYIDTMKRIKQSEEQKT